MCQSSTCWANLIQIGIRHVPRILVTDTRLPSDWWLPYENGLTVSPNLQTSGFPAAVNWQMRNAPNALTKRYITASTTVAQFVAMFVSDSIIIPTVDREFTLTAEISMTGVSWVFGCGLFGRIRILTNDDVSMFASDNNTAGTHHIFLEHMLWQGTTDVSTNHGNWKVTNCSNVVLNHMGIGSTGAGGFVFRAINQTETPGCHSNLLNECLTFTGPGGVNQNWWANRWTGGSAGNGTPAGEPNQVVRMLNIHAGRRAPMIQSSVRLFISNLFSYNMSTFANNKLAQCGAVGDTTTLTELLAVAWGGKEGPDGQTFSNGDAMATCQAGGAPSMTLRGAEVAECTPELVATLNFEARNMGNDWVMTRDEPAECDLLGNDVTSTMEPPASHIALAPGTDAVQAALYSHLLLNSGPWPNNRPAAIVQELIDDLENGTHNFDETVLGTWPSEDYGWQSDPDIANASTVDFNPVTGRTEFEEEYLRKAAPNMMITDGSLAVL